MGELKVGDRIRIIGVPHGPNEDTPIETIQVFQRLIYRNRSVRIAYIQDDLPWFECRFRTPGGDWVYHSIGLLPEEGHLWKRVQPRMKSASCT